jgi:hypothetical protein
MSPHEESGTRLAGIRSLLKDLDSVAQRKALLVCFNAAPHDAEFLREVEEARNKIILASRALRKLRAYLVKVRLELESTLGGSIGSMSETIRSAHIPEGSPALLPIPELSGLENYYRLKAMADPSEPLGKFVEQWPIIETFARQEADFLRQRGRSIRVQKGKRRRHSWQNGRLEYVLWQLFGRSSARKMLKKETEEQIELISRKLFGVQRQIDPDRGGCQAIREAITRVRKHEQHKHQCDSFLKS